MSFSSLVDAEELENDDLQQLFEEEEENSSVDPPMEQWSSLEIPVGAISEDLFLAAGARSVGSGEICAKYIAMSDSDVLRHVYYNYPAVTDPGINEALNQPVPKTVYPFAGQDLYLAICEDMNQTPVRIFHRGLLTDKIDLRYYCINPIGIRAMGLALQYNLTVRVLDLTDNFLSDDACFHLGEMLAVNTTLRELVLSGCRIQPPGLRQLLKGLIDNSELYKLNLNKNELEDEGLELFAEAVFRGIKVQEVHLSRNKLGSKGINALAEALETHNQFKILNLSWNHIFAPEVARFLITRLSENDVLEEVDLSWNSLEGEKTGTALALLFTIPTIKHVDLSNNKLSDEAIANLVATLNKAKHLQMLNLSYNPITTVGALTVIERVKSNAVKVQNVYMDNVYVGKAFLDILERMKTMKSKKNTVITYGGIQVVHTFAGPDMRELLLNRIEYLTKGRKRKSVDFGLVVLELEKQFSMLESKAFAQAIKEKGASLDSSLIDELVEVFIGRKTQKANFIDIERLADYVRRKWPERKLPPTPPPVSEPEVEVLPKEVKRVKKKGKKK